MKKVIAVSALILITSVVIHAQVNINYLKEVKISNLAVARIRENLPEINEKRLLLGLSPVSDADLTLLEAEAVLFGDDIVYEVSYDFTPTIIETSLMPAAVDNSLLNAFPEIRNQGNLGTCVTWAVAYYQYSYERRMIEGWDGNPADNSTLASPRWVHTMGGLAGGTTSSEVYEVLMVHGAATWEEFPYIGTDPYKYGDNPQNIQVLPTDLQIWRNAINRRADNFGYINAEETGERISVIKAMLLNGHVLVADTKPGNWHHFALIDSVRVKDNPATPQTDTHTDEMIILMSENEYGTSLSTGHGVTIVGYDDNIWADINNNNVVDSGELGAFKIANSWGAAWANNGFIWVAYDSFWLPDSQVVDAPVPGINPDIPLGTIIRTGTLTSSDWVIPKKNYIPEVLAKAAIRHSNRWAMGVQFGDSELAATSPVRLLQTSFSFSGGQYALDGSEGEVSFTFLLDVSDYVKKYNEWKYYLRLRTHETISTIEDFILIDVQNGELAAYSSYDTPVTAFEFEYVDAAIIHEFGNIIPSGDVNEDGIINQYDIDDILLLLNDEPISASLPAADTNRDGYISMHDAWVIDSYLSGNIASLPLPFTVGDVNADGNIDPIDSLLIAQCYVGLRTLEPYRLIAGDVNADTVLNIIDALRVAQYYVKLIDDWGYARKQ